MSSPPNRLAREKSPYLLQHAHNPVDWYAWGEEAFARAKELDRPVFLSIGYSTCHWCHVMERESFEDDHLARFLNDHFVCIKVDREERPDVDRIYMTFVQATTGGGGWPLNCFLTPEREPFYGGTYFPPESRPERPAFLAVLERIGELWQQRRGEIRASARRLQSDLAQALAQSASGSATRLTSAVLSAAGQALQQGYDPVHGGFGAAPKFPQPCQPAFLLRYAHRFKDPAAVQRVLHTCDAMANGGLHDQLGGGFSRYSVDDQWLVPHFEKMLYDNAQLAELYLEAHLVSGQPRYAALVRDIVGYVLRDLTHPDGGFYSAEDADSEGHEGKFYCWTRAELASLLSSEEFNVAVAYYGVTAQGNFTDHSRPDPLPGQNVLHVARPNLPQPDQPLLEAARLKMLAARARRVRPHLDDKILVSWNGLMLGALARAGTVLGEDSYLQAAGKNLAFLQERLWEPGTQTLHHRWRDGERDTVQLLNAYAFLLQGVLALYQGTLHPAHLEFAVALAEGMIARFYDAEQGGFWQSQAQTGDLILRIKEEIDGAEPSGNSVAILALLRLAAVTGRRDLRACAEKSQGLFSDRLQRHPQAVPFLLGALDFWLEEPQRVVIAGDPAAAATRALVRAAHSVYQPNQVVLGTAGPVEPFARTLTPREGRPTAYLCTGTACQAPLSEPAALRQRLCSH